MNLKENNDCPVCVEKGRNHESLTKQIRTKWKYRQFLMLLEKADADEVDMLQDFLNVRKKEISQITLF
ncbi:hypothetical protein FO433_01610 [Weissella cibaria]|uniref:hypothetical protein n=1 Tax=Weissella cibaria TaxID=137591 RepID=UPI0011973068|nr:hypothetical protein [Weissella cibaria]TVV24587.1 hypothetical protein FO433_01610 [Weissella cibaria]